MESVKATTILLIRHGESAAQVAGLVPGHDTCSGLTDLGRRQASALRDRFLATDEAQDVDVLYTSVLRRAIETAELVSPSLRALVPQPECDWCELHPGKAEGATWDDLQHRLPEGIEVDDPYRRLLPGMESWAEMYARVGARLLDVASTHAGGTAVVVAHGGTIAASFAALGSTSLRQALALTRTAMNTSITEWRAGRAGWRLMRYNDTAHLASPDLRSLSHLRPDPSAT